jgi:CDP-diacylglycerol--glycerol-3-phosphate 3-phosphatidyltransferase
MKYAPNALSITRIALSLSLFSFVENPLLFSLVYGICGLSDAMDGILARRFKSESLLGAKLDSLADFIFVTVVISALVFFTNVLKNLLALVCIVAVLLVRAGNLVITRLKFSQWSSMHTMGNKASLVVLFFSVPLCVMLGSAPLSVILAVTTLGLLAAFEETHLLVTSKEYDVNSRGSFGRFDIRKASG